MSFSRRETYKSVFKFEDPPLHDPVAVLYCFAPQLFETEAMHVALVRSPYSLSVCAKAAEILNQVTDSAIARGQTVCDIWQMSDKEKNVK